MISAEMTVTLPAYQPPTESLVHGAVGTCIALMREHGCSAVEAAKAVVQYAEYCTIDPESAREMAEYAEHCGIQPEIEADGTLLLPVCLARAVREAVGL